MINCTITSPQETKYYKNVQSITLPASSGQIQILPGHVEAFILLKKDNIILRQLAKQKKIIQIQDGQCYIKDDLVTIIL